MAIRVQFKELAVNWQKKRVGKLEKFVFSFYQIKKSETIFPNFPRDQIY